ncbi:MAG: tail fiber domain-containing protein [Saprospiraceae bacterium]|nr:tail fiber domain-containing protein [Saprospiraceae bacterium]
MLFRFITFARNINKILPLSIALALLTASTWAQTDLKIGTSPGAISPSAVFEAASTTKGMLIPRMTTAQMNAISSPANGLQIYNTTDGCIYIYRTSAWLSTCSPTYAMAWGLLGNSGTTAGTNFIGTTDAQDVVLKRNNTEGLRLSSGKTVNTGDLTVSNRFIAGNMGTLDSLSLINAVGTQTSYTNNVHGLRADFTVTPPSGYTYSTFGGYHKLTVRGANGGNYHAGSLGYVSNENTGTVPVVVGAGGTVIHNSVGTIAGTYGLQSSIYNNSTGTITNAYGTYTQIYNLSTGTITNAYGEYITPFIKSGGTMTNAYGLYIDNQTAATNNYGIYVNGASTRALHINSGTSYFGGNVGINTTSPTYKLDIDAQTGGAGNPLRLLGLNAGATSDSIISSNSGILRRLSINQILANAWNITGNAGTVDGTNFIGTTDNIPLSMRVNNQKAGRIDNTLNNVFLGYQAGNVNTGTQNTFMGHQAGLVNTTGNHNTAIGNATLINNTSADFNTAIGSTALNANTTGLSNVAVGYQAAYANTSGAYNSALGTTALSGNTTGVHNTAIGFSALNANTIGHTNTAIGSRALKSNVSSAYNVAVGNNTLENSLGAQNTAVGVYALNLNTTGGGNTAIGYGTLLNNTTASYNTALGFEALNGNTTGSLNTAVGYHALLRITTGSNNVALGHEALVFGTTSTDNLALGNKTGFSNTTGSNNILLGNSSAYFLTTANNNVMVGYNSGYNNSTGNNNTFLGYQTGNGNNTGSNNTLLGFSANVSSIALSNATAIGANATVGASNSFVLGGTGANAVNVGINTTTPQYKLDIDAQTGGAGNPLRLLGLNAGATSDSIISSNSGILRRLSINQILGNAWNITGNAGTTAGTNFIGTTDAQALVFKTNNAEGMRLNTSGYLGIGTTTPSVQLDVTGRGNILTATTFNLFLNGGNATTTGTYNTNVGLNSMGNLTTGSFNVGVGAGTFNATTTGSYNTALGNSALNATTTGTSNAAFGHSALQVNTIGLHNAAFGTSALIANVSGNQNTGIGSYALSGVTTGNNNIGLGWGAGDNLTTGSDNIIVGYQVKAPSATGSGQLNIGNLLYGTSLGTGTTRSTGNIGINTTTPQYKLDIDAQTGSAGNPLRLLGLNAGATSDSIISSASGVLRRLSVNQVLSNAWNITGNSGTTAGTNFVGTTDGQSLVFKTNNTEGMRLNTSQNLGLGTTSPSYKLDVVGRSRFQTGSGTAGFWLTNAANTLDRTFYGMVNDTVVGMWSNVTSTNGFVYNISSGNIGMGIATPQANLHIYGSGTSGFSPTGTTAMTSPGAGAELAFSRGGAYKPTASVQLIDYNGYSGGLAFNVHKGTANSAGGTFADNWPTEVIQAMTIVNNGSIGIGTSDPNQQLEITAAMRMPATTTSTTGVIYKGANRFIHNYKPSANDGNNTFVGINAGNFTMSSATSWLASGNTGMGTNALTALTDGGYNAAFGNAALQANTTGSYNTALGNAALAANTTGAGNTAVGNNALNANTGSNNTSVGNAALYLNTTGTANTAVGESTLNKNTTGNQNTAVGQSSMKENLTGANNTALGLSALQANTTGNNNVAVGVSALVGNSTGGNNVALGYNALSATTSSNNTSVGYSAGTGATSGSGNTFVGYNTGLTLTTGSNNTFLGNTANVTSGTLTNATAIGNGATVNASNKIRLGNTSVTLVETYGSFVTISDRRKKTNITDNHIGLDFVKALRPVKYELKDQLGIIQDGFIAQEIDSVMQRLHIKTFSGLAKPANTEGYYTVSYATFVVPLVNAVKELDAKNEKALDENARLKEELERLKAENTSLKAHVDKNTQDIEAIKAALSKKSN